MMNEFNETLSFEPIRREKTEESIKFVKQSQAFVGIHVNLFAGLLITRVYSITTCMGQRMLRLQA